MCYVRKSKTEIREKEEQIVYQTVRSQASAAV
jgi:hypothetical protein